jgi:hypothetical protein
LSEEGEVKFLSNLSFQAFVGWACGLFTAVAILAAYDGADWGIIVLLWALSGLCGVQALAAAARQGIARK